MINEKLEKAFNDQINKELYSEYLYLSMQAYFERLNLKGFVNWFTVQVQEEHLINRKTTGNLRSLVLNRFLNTKNMLPHASTL